MAKITAYQDSYGKIHRHKSSADLADTKFQIETYMYKYNFTEGNVTVLLRALNDDFINVLKRYSKLKIQAEIDAKTETTTRPVKDYVSAKINHIDNR